MSRGYDFLHSHSGLERDLKFPKHTVLIDKEFEDLFKSVPHTSFRFNKIDYVKVNTYDFYLRGGVFKNLSE
jgi:hypothetical protein